MISGSAEDFSKIEKFQELIRNGHSKEDIKKNHFFDDFDEIFSIAKARIENAKTQKLPSGFIFNEDDLRFGTNQIVADYRAKRLSCSTIIDIGCGIGMQSIAFAKTCSKVIAIDIDARKIEYAKFNAAHAKVDNIEFHLGDGLAQLAKIARCDIIFCDPERPAQEVARRLSSLSPSPVEIVEKATRFTDKFCFELPPQLKELPFDCEKEYVSLNHALNRLNVYLGSLKKAETSAIVLPEEKTLSTLDEENIFSYASPLKFFYEVDSGVEKAGLKAYIPGNNLFMYDKYLTSEALVRGPFFKASYKILAVMPNYRPDIQNAMAKLDCGKLTLHGNVDPDKYWQEKKNFERGLHGEQALHLFLLGEEAVICEKLG